jgi:uncharacterized protein YjbI with pentapeptide repeats
VFVLPEADDEALRVIYDGTCVASPVELWRVEERYGASALERLRVVELIVVGAEQVTATLTAAIHMGAPEASLAGKLLTILRDEARDVGEGHLGIADLCARMNSTVEEVRRTLRVLHLIATDKERDSVTRGEQWRIPVSSELKRWNGRLADSPMPRPPLRLGQLATLHLYGIREFCDVRTGPTTAVFANVDLRGATIRNSTLVLANLPGARLDDGTLENVDLRGANLFESSLRNATLREVCMDAHGNHVTDLRRAVLDGAVLDRVQMNQIAIADASLRGVTMRRVYFGPSDPSGMNLDKARLEDRCAIDLERLATEADWSVVYLEGEAIYRNAPLVIDKRDLGWAIMLDGVDRGAIDLRGCAGLRVLTRNPDCGIHVFDLERVTLDHDVDDVGRRLTDEGLALLLETAKLKEVAAAKRFTALDAPSRARLVAALRYLVFIDLGGRSGNETLGSEAEALRRHIVAELGEDGSSRFPCAGPIEKMRKRVVGQLRTALDRITECDGRLTFALADAFTLREFCSYRPDVLQAEPGHRDPSA